MEGRFISRDPISFAGGDVNLYGYVQNNPVNWIDPWGLRFSSPPSSYMNIRPPTSWPNSRREPRPLPDLNPPNPANPNKRAPSASNPDSNRPKGGICRWEWVPYRYCADKYCPDNPSGGPCYRRADSDFREYCICYKWDVKWEFEKVCE